MKTGMIFTAVRKGIAGFLAVMLILAFGTSVFAGAFDDYYDYQNEDGTYSYYFTQGVTVTMDKFWYQHTRVIADDNGATFYHKASYEKYKEEGYEGGRLFTLSASVNTDFKKLPSFTYIGFDEEACMNYFAVLPTDVQAWMEDENIRKEYEKLYRDVDDVIDGIELTGSASESTAD